MASGDLVVECISEGQWVGDTAVCVGGYVHVHSLERQFDHWVDRGVQLLMFIDFTIEGSIYCKLGA